MFTLSTWHIGTWIIIFELRLHILEENSISKFHENEGEDRLRAKSCELHAFLFSNCLFVWTLRIQVNVVSTNVIISVFSQRIVPSRILKLFYMLVLCEVWDLGPKSNSTALSCNSCTSPLLLIKLYVVFVRSSLEQVEQALSNALASLKLGNGMFERS